MTATINRHPAWQTAGSWISTKENEGLTAREVLAQANLLWTVEKTPLETQAIGPEGVTTLEVPNKVGITRFDPQGNPLDVLGVVGSGYVPFQNADMISLLDGLVDGAGASFEAAGHYKGHTNTFVAMRLPEGFTVGDDQTDVYLFASNAHDGSGAFRVAVTGMRLLCTNMIRGIHSSADYSISLRHTKNFDVKVEQVRAVLNLQVKKTEEMRDFAAALFAEPMSKSEFVSFTETLLPIHDEMTERVMTKRLDEREALLDVFTGPTVSNIANTRWAAWNAVSEFDQWVRPVRGADRAQRHLEKFDTLDRLTERATGLLLPA